MVKGGGGRVSGEGRGREGKWGRVGEGVSGEGRGRFGKGG